MSSAAQRGTSFSQAEIRWLLEAWRVVMRGGDTSALRRGATFARIYRKAVALAGRPPRLGSDE